MPNWPIWPNFEVHWIFIFLFVLGAEYLPYVKFIAIHALTFCGYIISVLASVFDLQA